MTHRLRRTCLLLAVLVGSDLESGRAQTNLDMRLEPDLVIGEANGVSFGGNLHVAVDSHGLIYVGDWMNTNVRVFSVEGAPLETIGRRGRGPGEFTAIHQVVVARGDSLYVYDASAFRLSVFAPGPPHPLAYTITVAPPEGMGFPGRAFVPDDADEGYLFAFIRQAAGTLEVHRVNSRGEVAARAILSGRNSEATVRRQASGSVVQVTRTAPIYGRRALVGLTPDNQLFYGWSGDVDLTFYDLAGKWAGVFRAVAETVPVTEADIEYALRDASDQRRRALEDTELPETKPALEAVLVDDRLRIWLDRFTADPTVSEWWVTVRSEPTQTAVFTLPDEVKLQAVSGDYAYGVSEDAEGFPTVVRYRIRSTSD